MHGISSKSGWKNLLNTSSIVSPLYEVSKSWQIIGRDTPTRHTVSTKSLGDCTSPQPPNSTSFLHSKKLLTHSTFKSMTTLLRNKRRFYIRPRSTWRNELRNLYGNFLSYHFRLSTQGSHLIYLPGPRGWIVDSFFYRKNSSVRINRIKQPLISS